MTRMTGPDCAVMCNLVNTHTHTTGLTQGKRSGQTRLWAGKIIKKNKYPLSAARPRGSQRQTTISQYDESKSIIGSTVVVSHKGSKP